VSDTWEVVGNTLYLRKPAPSAPSREHVDWIAFPGYAEAAHRICAERNKAVAALETRLAEVAPVVEAAVVEAAVNYIRARHPELGFARSVHKAQEELDALTRAVFAKIAADHDRAARAKREASGA